MSRQAVIGIGGPAYTGVVRTEHCVFVANLVAELYHNTFDVRVNYLANTLVGNARANLLTNAVDRGYDLLISIDSDTFSPNADQMFNVVWQGVLSMMLAASIREEKVLAQYVSMDEIQTVKRSMAQRHDIALIGFAASQRDHKLAVWSGPGIRMSLDDWAQPLRRAYATGLSFAVFNCDWYRRHRLLMRRFDCMVDGPSEDYSHCEHVGKAGGLIYAAAAPVIHRPWGSDETLVFQPQIDDSSPPAAA